MVLARDDFFKWVNEEWLDKTEIPDGFSRYGTFEILDLENKDKIKNVIFNSTNSRLVHLRELVWSSNKRNDLKDYPMAMFVRYIKRQVNKDFTNIITHFSKYGIKTFFSLYVGQDAKDSRMDRLHLSSSGCLSLSSRDYYEKEDENKELFSEWKRVMKNVCCMTDEMADSVIEFEKDMAKISLYPHENRDVDARYNAYADMNEFYNKFIGFDWKQLFINLGIGLPEKIIVNYPDFFVNVSELMDKTDLDVINQWFMWCVYRQWGKYCGDKMEKSMFELYGTALSGVKEMRPLEERNINIVKSTLGEVVGEEYVKMYFPSWKKDVMKEYIDVMLSIYKDRVDCLEWMSDETKEKAKEKLSRMNVKIGYPDEWEGYDGVKEIKTTMVEQLMDYARYEYSENWKKMDKPTDVNEWHMTPQTINAYYNPLLNEIVFPAAILQPPFMMTKEDDDMNGNEMKAMGRTMGGIGSVIAHEISHALDDKGSKFDANGNINMWWLDVDRIEFDKLVESYSAQFEKQMVNDMSVNGKLTAGENIADLGGITIAYFSLIELLDRKGGDVSEYDVMEAKREFFMGWGNIWKYKSTDKDVKRRLLTDPHAPNHLRVNMPLKNFKPFLELFGIEKGDGMWEDEPVCIW